MKRLLAGLLALVVVFPALADQKPEKKEEAKKPIVVPFEILKSGHMAVMVKIEGKGPYKLIFDTGAPTTLITSKVGRETGLYKGGPSLMPILGGTAVIKSMEVGDARAEKVSTAIIDHPTVKALADALEEPLEGIVGYTFFGRYRTTIDYKAKTLTLVPNGHEAKDALASLQSMLMARMLSNKPPEPVIVSSGSHWGLVVAKNKDDEKPGVTIQAVLPNSPAATAGLKKGDRLLIIDGRWTDSVEDTYRAAGFVKPGQTVDVVIERDGKEAKLKVKPGKSF